MNSWLIRTEKSIILNPQKSLNVSKYCLKGDARLHMIIFFFFLIISHLLVLPYIRAWMLVKKLILNKYLLFLFPFHRFLFQCAFLCINARCFFFLQPLSRVVERERLCCQWIQLHMMLLLGICRHSAIGLPVRRQIR